MILSTRPPEMQSYCYNKASSMSERKDCSEGFV